ncbi:hypothetical protein [Alkalicoccus chagannorensis]|uniref:hypothetical protein n=1 Tax=Alkalicoccus chagannorensis TaxID=427072 RepID=UPI00040BCAD2|nr:hypothetical protein [Alkalicoccus chagannorensis]
MQKTDYAGPRADYYKRKLDRHRRPERFAGWNSAAAAAAPLWSASRHMYGWTGLYFLWLLLLLTVESFLPAVLGLTADAQATPVLFVIGMIPAHVLFGLFGNAWYAAKLQKIQEHQAGERRLAPVFQWYGFSVPAALLTNVVLGLFILFPAVLISQWQFNPPLDHGVYVYMETDMPPQGALDVRGEPVFEKYEDGLNILYSGEAVGDQEITVELYYWDDFAWDLYDERSTSFFSDERVTMDLLDLEDPAVPAGEYEVHFYLDEELHDTVPFTVTPPAS